MHTIADDDTAFAIDMAPESTRNPTTWFAGVRRGNAYVSYYLMPIYVEPTLLEDLTRRGYERTAGDPAWGVARREERGMAYRKAMSGGRHQNRKGGGNGGLPRGRGEASTDPRSVSRPADGLEGGA
jgi:hypothetical protein